MSGESIAVVGATGAVGRETLLILASRGVPAGRVRAVASARSAGAGVAYGRESIRVVELTQSALAGVRLAVLCTEADVSRAWAPRAAALGAVVIDNSSAFRLDPAVPLVVPEVNGDELRGLGPGKGVGIIANPNCCVAILTAALEPWRREFGVRELSVCTYQAVSGAGAAAIDEMHEQAAAVLAGGEVRRRVFSEPCAFNVFAHNSAVDEGTGLCGEERKIIEETRRIWRAPGLDISPTCFRVSVERAHTLAITVRLWKRASESRLREALAGVAGLRLVDDRARNAFPTPLLAAGRDEVVVGRVRPDPRDRPDVHGRFEAWHLTACGDQLRKGAALNAIQIADRLGLVDAEPTARSA